MFNFHISILVKLLLKQQLALVDLYVKQCLLVNLNSFLKSQMFAWLQTCSTRSTYGTKIMPFVFRRTS